MAKYCTAFAAALAAPLPVKAREWNRTRIVRAVEQVGGYRLLPDGGLICKETAELRSCEEVRTWAALPGTVAFIGCDCEDEIGHLVPLRRQLEASGVSTPVFCKHHWIRCLFAGHTVGVPPMEYIGGGDFEAGRWIRVTLKGERK